MSHSAGHGRSSRPLIGRSRLGRQPPRIQLEAAEERYKHVVNLWWKVEGSAVPLPEATTVEMDPMRREMGRLSGRVAHIDREKLSDTPNTTQAPPADVERFSNLTVEFKQALDSALIATRE